MRKRQLLLLGIYVAAQTLSLQARADESLPLRNPALPVEQRAADVVSRMTLEEKAAQLGHVAPAIPRLGVPEYNWWNEGLHGVARAGFATVFPQAIGMAATWDTGLLHTTADVISTEFRAKYAETLHSNGGSDWYRGLTVWSPNLNIFRDPRWGRGQETYGEDPYLTSRMGIAFIQGLQGDDAKYLKTIATSKHFAVHSGPESTRHQQNTFVTPHDLNDTYLPAFRATVTEGKVESVMCVYNAIDGVPGCANKELLNERLRKDWGFKGYVVSDCGAAANVFRPDSLHFAPSAETGVAVAFRAGMDLICGDYRNNMSTEPDAIVAAVHKGLLPISVVDQALTRLFSARIRLGMFDPPADVPYTTITPAANDTEAHRDVALHMAQEALVLLKNQDKLLPLNPAIGSIAVVGPNATNLDALVGNYSGTPSHPVNIVDGLRARFPKATITYAEGTGLIGPVTGDIPASVLCVDASCKVSGLKADYFPNTELAGKPVLTRNEAMIDFTYGSYNRNGDLAPLKKAYSTRWTGVIKAPESGEYRLGFTTDDGYEDGYKLWVDGKLIGNSWADHQPSPGQTSKVRLEKNHSYAIRVEFFQSGANGGGRLLWNMPSQDGTDAVEAARKADVVVFVAGLSPHIEGEEMKVNADGFAGGDRTTLDLPAPQEALLQRVQAAGKPVVLVLMNGSAMSINWADSHIPAIVEAWYPGEEGGAAVAGLLAGDFSPSGRLPVTFYKSVDQLPAFNDYAMNKRTYRYFDGEVLYPFGYGLSYTNFVYGDARVSNDQVAATGEVNISVDITNAGAMAGDEVVQLYVTHPGVEGAAIRALKGFKRVHLDKGEKQTVEFTLSDRGLATVDDVGKYRIVPGPVDVWVGGGQPVAHAGVVPSGQGAHFTITSGATLAD